MLSLGNRAKYTEHHDESIFSLQTFCGRPHLLLRPPGGVGVGGVVVVVVVVSIGLLMMLLRHTRDIHGSSINAAMMMLCPQHHGGSGERESSRCNKSQQLGARFVSNVGKVLTRGREPCTSKNCVSRLSSDSGRCQVDLHRHLTGCLTFRNSLFQNACAKGLEEPARNAGSQLRYRSLVLSDLSHLFSRAPQSESIEVSNHMSNQCLVCAVAAVSGVSSYEELKLQWLG